MQNINKDEPWRTDSAHNQKNYRKIKRWFDCIASTIVLLVIWPFLVLIAIAIRIDSRGPAIYMHERVGLNHKPIRIYKFRTMHQGSDDISAAFSCEQMQEWNDNFKLANDPRVTRVGAFLRKTSLDELPQLLNILRGDMSLVGPRPVVSEELARYGENQDKFLSVVPGLTGYWQAYARNDCTYERRIEMELYYVDHACARFDVKILFRTVGRVLSRKGAY